MEELFGIIFFLIFGGIAILQNLKKNVEDQENPETMEPEENPPAPWSDPETGGRSENQMQKHGQGPNRSATQVRHTESGLKHTDSVLKSQKEQSYKRGPEQKKANYSGRNAQRPGSETGSRRVRDIEGETQEGNTPTNKKSLPERKGAPNLQHTTVESDDSGEENWTPDGIYSSEKWNPYDMPHRQRRNKDNNEVLDITPGEFRKENLKKNFIWKEILDRPVSLRE
ncbi:MAG: hypothetical protein ACOCSE_03960 [Chitinivibrionales bacterium]